MNKISKQKKQEAKAYTITFGIIKIANGTLIWFQTFRLHATSASKRTLNVPSHVLLDAFVAFILLVWNQTCVMLAILYNYIEIKA